MWPSVAVEADPVSDDAGRVLEAFKAVAVDTLFLQRTDDALGHALLAALEPVAVERTTGFRHRRLALNDVRHQRHLTLRCPAFDLVFHAHTHSQFCSLWLEQFFAGSIQFDTRHERTFLVAQSMMATRERHPRRTGMKVMSEHQTLFGRVISSSPEQIRADQMSRVRLARLGSPGNRLKVRLAHQAADPLAASLDIYPRQPGRNLAVSGERILRVQRFDRHHQAELAPAGR